jgi:hypothetical protein
MKEHPWARLLAYVTGLINQELLLKNDSGGRRCRRWPAWLNLTPLWLGTGSSLRRSVMDPSTAAIRAGRQSSRGLEELIVKMATTELWARCPTSAIPSRIRR